MSIAGNIGHTRWPLDLKLLGWLAGFWAAVMIGQIVLSDLTYMPTPFHAIALGMKFEGLAARVAMAVQAMALSTAGIGLVAERRWGLWFAIVYMTEVALSRLIFMTAYLNNFTEVHNVRSSGFLGIAAVVILLYLWIRAHDLIWDHPGP